MYKFRLNGIMKHIDAEEAVRELEWIKDNFGAITPDIVVEVASNKASPLHNYFEWDNRIASEKWRLQQARVLINNIEVQVIKDGGEKTYVAAYEIGAERTYKNITTFDKDDIEFVKETTKREITYLKKKLSVYNKFDNVVFTLDEAILEIEKI